MPAPKNRSPFSLADVLRDHLLPWAENNPRQRIIVAKPVMKAAELPEGVQMERRKLKGKRIITKNNRLYANTRVCSARWPDEGLHETEIPELLCVLGGQCDYRVEEYLLTCTAGHFIFMPPHTPHPDGRRSHLQEAKGSCDLLHIVAYRGGIQCWICHSRGAEHYGAATENYLFLDGQMNQLFELLVGELSKSNDRRICNGLFLSFMAALQRETTAEHYLHPGPAARTPSSASGNEFVQSLENYIRLHLNEHLTLENVARQLYMSRAQFVRRMRQETGQTFVEFLTDHRIEEAKKLLLESEWTAQTISQFIGFKSPDYFYTFFQRHVGCTPSEFRVKERHADVE
jgi:AraC-like DNA-binding protein